MTTAERTPAKEWRSEWQRKEPRQDGARGYMVKEVVSEVMDTLPEDQRALIESHAPSRPRVFANLNLIRRVGIGIGELSVAFQATRAEGEALGMFRDSAQDALTVSLLAHLRAGRQGNAPTPAPAREGIVLEASVPPLPASTYTPSLIPPP